MDLVMDVSRDKMSRMAMSCTCRSLRELIPGEDQE